MTVVAVEGVVDVSPAQHHGDFAHGGYAPRILMARSGEVLALNKRVQEAQRAGDWARAATLLREILALPSAREGVAIHETWYELVETLRNAKDYDGAIEAMRNAIAAGWNAEPDPQADIAEMHLLAGRRAEGDAIYADLRKRMPEDIWLYNSAGLTYQEIGAHATALDWLTAGLEMALDAGDPNRIVDQLAWTRGECLNALGQEQDALQLRAQGFMDADDAKRDSDQRRWELERQEHHSQAHAPVVSLAWFPAEEWTEARRRWSDLQEAELPADHAAYTKVIESRIQRLSRDIGRNVMVAPIQVEALEEYSRRHGLDPNTAETRAQFAAELTRLGLTLNWPPGRNDRCWCGSGLKYKRCCATVPDDRAPTGP